MVYTMNSLILITFFERQKLSAHRSRQAIRLDLEIECFVSLGECSDDEAKLWEIAENLQRAELTALERSELEAEWITPG